MAQSIIQQMSLDQLDKIAQVKRNHSWKVVLWGISSFSVSLCIFFYLPTIPWYSNFTIFSFFIYMGYLVLFIGLGIAFRSFWCYISSSSVPIWHPIQKKLAGLVGEWGMVESSSYDTYVAKPIKLTPQLQHDEFGLRRRSDKIIGTPGVPSHKVSRPSIGQASFVSPERKFSSRLSPASSPMNIDSSIENEHDLREYLSNYKTDKTAEIEHPSKYGPASVSPPRSCNRLTYDSSSYRSQLPTYYQTSPMHSTSPQHHYGHQMHSSIYSTPPSQRYAVLPRVLPSEKDSNKEESTGSKGSASDVAAAWKLLEELGLSASIHELSDNVRRLLARHLQTFVAAFNQNTEELVACGISRSVLDRELLVQPVFQPPGQSVARANISLADMLIQFIQEPYFLSKVRPGVNLIHEHKSYDRYFLEEGKDEQNAYVLKRMKALAEDGYLGQLRWDSGGSWKGVEWEKQEVKLPTDAEIIMNIFCALMDGFLPPAFEGDRPFRRTHYLNSNLSKTSGTTSIRGRFLIFLAQKQPPNFKVVVNGKIREVLPGKKNCFHAIVLFLHAVKQQKSGHLGNINLHSILEQVFDSA